MLFVVVVVVVFETRTKKSNTMQNYWVLQNRQYILAVRLRMATALLIKDHLVFLSESSPIGQQNETCGAIGPHCGAKEPPTAEAS